MPLSRKNAIHFVTLNDVLHNKNQTTPQPLKNEMFHPRGGEKEPVFMKQRIYSLIFPLKCACISF